MARQCLCMKFQFNFNFQFAGKLVNFKLYSLFLKSVTCMLRRLFDKNNVVFFCLLCFRLASKPATWILWRFLTNTLASSPSTVFVSVLCLNLSHGCWGIYLANTMSSFSSVIFISVLRISPSRGCWGVFLTKATPGNFYKPVSHMYRSFVNNSNINTKVFIVTVFVKFYFFDLTAFGFIVAIVSRFH